MNPTFSSLSEDSRKCKPRIEFSSNIIPQTPLPKLPGSTVMKSFYNVSVDCYTSGYKLSSARSIVYVVICSAPRFHFVTSSAIRPGFCFLNTQNAREKCFLFSQWCDFRLENIHSENYEQKVASASMEKIQF